MCLFNVMSKIFTCIIFKDTNLMINIQGGIQMSDTTPPFSLAAFMHDINFTLSLTHIIIFFFMAFIIHVIVAENKSNNIRWLDMLSHVDANGNYSKSISLSKLLQMVGGITGTWVIIVYTIKLSLTAEMFFTYLAYVGGVEGWSKFVNLRYGSGSVNNASSTADPKTPQ